MKPHEITNELFDETLRRILDGYRGTQLLDIPGIYEVLAEHFNNDVVNELCDEETE